MPAMEDEQVHRRRSRRRHFADSTSPRVRLAQLVRSPRSGQSARSEDGSDGAIAIDIRGLRVTIGREADVGIVAMVVAILGAGGGR
jgi:hypothetical protein